MNAAFVNALEMLPVPGRVDGGRCVWCREEATLNLGPRLHVVDGALHRSTPRACTNCARNVAAHTHRVHRKTCARCTEWEHCPDSRALLHLAHGSLNGLIREG